ncbi:hypothetical protein N7516_002073 [Penicillium verrucosum]|uniref:uncharacterized protein n=1 Tax=Penicillium verrucosum TaxID=60171 RepID=UPI0025457FA8|nr:uncharacterized protein N7516_002073 [Penicillium verrucosum]KAJ5941905.1 hypothetical protein N7516_002073 [Penicillium verrucosum]
MKPLTISFLLGLASLATARTDLEGCVSSKVIFDHYYASYLWYVPDSGEICSFLDCGGGRAPPKTTQPGCPQYSGTATLTADYLEGWGPNGKQAASTSTVASTASSTTDIVLASATQTSEASDSSSASSFSSSSPSGTQTADSMITNAPSGLTVSTSSASNTGSATSTSAAAAATSSSAFNAAASTPTSNVAGVMAVMAAMVGVMVL